MKIKRTKVKELIISIIIILLALTFVVKESGILKSNPLTDILSSYNKQKNSTVVANLNQTNNNQEDKEMQKLSKEGLYVDGKQMQDGIRPLTEQEIEYFKKEHKAEYDELLKISWNTQDKNPLTNGNAEKLINTIKPWGMEKRPPVLLNRPDVKKITEKIENYYGQGLTTYGTLDKYEELPKDSNISKQLVNGKKITKVLYNTDSGSVIQYIVSDNNYSEYLTKGHNIQFVGYPIGIIDQTLVIAYDKLY